MIIMNGPSDATDLRNLRSLEEFAWLLDASLDELVDLLLWGTGSNYTSWAIKKKSGGYRRINAPKSNLKRIQGRLKPHLDALYAPRASAHGFIADRSTITNAAEHLGKRWVLNIDLQDFFPSISLRRVEGLLKARPYSLNPTVASAIARLATHEGRLPVGSPLSPTLSNMICQTMDRDLQKLAGASHAWYSRYADDLTFSSNTPEFPATLATWDGSHWGAGPSLTRIIGARGFLINQKKVRLQHRSTRQTVTGLVVNEKANVPREYVRNLRATMHCWQKHGYLVAEERLQQVLAGQSSTENDGEKNKIRLSDHVAGKLAYLSMVRGAEDDLVRRFHQRWQELAQTQPPPSGLTP